jgi:hypothetical protein
MHRTDNAQIVRAGTQVWKNLADFKPRLTVARELEWGLHQATRLALRFQISPRWTLPIVFVQRWLGVKSIDLRGPAIHEQMDNPFGPRGKHWATGSQRI